VSRRRTTPATRLLEVLPGLGAVAGVYVTMTSGVPMADPCRHARLGACLGDSFVVFAVPYATNALLGALAALALGAVLLLAWRAMGSAPGAPAPNRPAIPERVRHEVWRRDGGSCVDCGSRARLEFDHIIPFSRGGSGTARNLELRCEPCNRRKGARI
jgi:hypothetical protein